MEKVKSDLRENYDVVIMGSGPGGAGVAKALTGSGLKTVIIERASLPRNKMCSGLLFPRAQKIISHEYKEMPSDLLIEPRKINRLINRETGTKPVLNNKWTWFGISAHAKQSVCVSGINFPRRFKKFLRS